METDYFESFVWACRLGSMAKASERLNMTQPALGKQIRRLETHYGVPLLRRTTAGVEPTAAGSLLLTRIEPVLRELRAIGSELARPAEPAELRLGTLPSLAAHYLPDKIYRMENGPSPLRIKLTLKETSAEIYEQLRSGEIDCAVIERHQQQQQLWTRELFSEPYFAALPQRHPLASRETVSLRDLAEEQYVLYPPACGIRRTVSRLLAKHGLTPSLKDEVPFGDFILGYVAAGAGITIVPRIIAEHAGGLPLSFVPIDDPEASRTIVLVSASAQAGMKIWTCLKPTSPPQSAGRR